MKLEDISKIAVIGAGTMGQGIAQICAMAGYEVVIYDLSEQTLATAEANISTNLDKGIERGKVTQAEKIASLERITFSGDERSLVADVIIEAIIENLDVKKALFANLEAINSENTILASNTSSIPITRIAAGLKYPKRFVGMHFFNPAHIMKLVEVISGVATDDNVVNTIADLARKLGKTPVMAADAPGFIVNRVARHFYVEGLKVLEEGVSDVNGIDRLMESSGSRMAGSILNKVDQKKSRYGGGESRYGYGYGTYKYSYKD